MRIATSNLERLRRGRSRARTYDTELHNLGADVIVVTEPGPGFRDRHPQAIMSPENRASGEAWVAIVGPLLEPVALNIPYQRLAVASRFDLDGAGVMIYGSVLPWLSAGTHAPDVFGQQSRKFGEIFETALDEQLADMIALRSMYPEDYLLWAGDFNHTLVGPALSAEASIMLKNAIASLGLKAVNAESPHRAPGWHALDLICVEEAWMCSSVESYYPLLDDRPLSDHRWYVAEVRPR